VQTFTWEADPDGVALETLVFEDLGDGRTRLHTQSLCDSYEGRTRDSAAPMEVGVDRATPSWTPSSPPVKSPVGIGGTGGIAEGAKA
jgi:hypothetical protein